mmetsp:Transcript_70849/g.160282  ORF Transcript_70849/g.160282 Transcript_70849/m.160282 type:complete len:215 (+) Transcript_70849:355-999(+)
MRTASSDVTFSWAPSARSRVTSPTTRRAASTPELNTLHTRLIATRFPPPPSSPPLSSPPPRSLACTTSPKLPLPSVRSTANLGATSAMENSSIAFFFPEEEAQAAFVRLEPMSASSSESDPSLSSLSSLTWMGTRGPTRRYSSSTSSNERARFRGLATAGTTTVGACVEAWGAVGVGRVGHMNGSRIMRVCWRGAPSRKGSREMIIQEIMIRTS